MEVSAIQTHSKGAPNLKDTNVTRASQSQLTPNRPKTPFSPGKNPISIHT